MITRSAPGHSVILMIFLQVKKKKNISHDAFGTKLGRVHMQKQDLTKLRTRKMKGLRKRKATPTADGEPEGHDSKAPKVDG